jgi:hypothetical protein
MVVGGLVATGCGSRARAASPPEIPPLAVPLPPPRVFAPAAEEPPLAALPGNTDPALDAEPPTVPKPAPPRRDPAPQTASKPAASSGAPAPPAVETSREPPPPTAAEAAEQKKIEQQLDAVQRDLKRVQSGYSRLSSENKNEYNNARRFVDNALKGLKERDLNYARVNADLAQVIAKSLLTSVN